MVFILANITLSLLILSKYTFPAIRNCMPKLFILTTFSCIYLILGVKPKIPTFFQLFFIPDIAFLASDITQTKVECLFL